MSSDLEKRVRVLEDERGILATLCAYGHTIDYGEKEAWLDLFTEDAVYHVTMRGKTLPAVIVPQPEGGLKGKKILSEYIHKHTNAPNAYHKHMMVEPRITLESDTTASAVSYFERLDETKEGAAYTLVFGRYVDKLVKGPDGKWRFKVRRIEMENSRPVPR